ncbi:MBL fold metallo-hydrolase [Methanocorpusculum sp. MG]|uniref:MBL fold metallo-hydrolase n=1 Tax=Methanocorpusculum petauri TaxID=3002863 RepID=A0ABT4IIG5_9EURY|nr:MBL fold metallo-hydrolase [Methanocorpusculum petauri]MCZ0861533.1 MBL fold metallo-hydrolase [Methanocorpusculum petauri]MDE2444113.1 MBL fold metallo-hydrolase [Methanocorpusculum sp.]
MTPSDEISGAAQRRPYIDETFQQRIRPYIEILNDDEAEKYFAEAETAVEQLASIGKDPKEVLQIMENIGLYLSENSGENFTADYQKIQLSEGRELWSIQLPGGGNINLFRTPDGDMVLDTGYGCCYYDVERMLHTLGIDGFAHVKKVICTHADADHCGAAGFLPVTPLMHPVTKQILDAGTRGFGSSTNNEDLERAYTTTINTFSKMNIPEQVDLCKTERKQMHGLFPVIDEVEFGGMHFEIWESLGGHIAGQLFLYEKNEGLLFTSDALINFASMTKVRKNYCSIADYLVTSVNVNSDIARIERHELMRIAKEIDAELKEKGKRLLLCCGHGAVSMLDDTGNMISACEPIHYTAQ